MAHSKRVRTQSRKDRNAYLQRIKKSSRVAKEKRRRSKWADNREYQATHAKRRENNAKSR